MSDNQIIAESVDISYDEQVVIQGINDDQPFTAKIDTGADVCSLHATDISVNIQMVSFTINNRQYKMPVHTIQSIKQADSNPEQRPVVMLDFTIAQQHIQHVECNLNDRSGMSSELLIGRNLLDKRDFVIHTNTQQPNQNESAELPVESLDEKDDVIVQKTSRILKEVNECRVSLQRLMQELYQLNEKIDEIAPPTNPQQ